jgi:hypothetical protein
MSSIASRLGSFWAGPVAVALMAGCSSSSPGSPVSVDPVLVDGGDLDGLAGEVSCVDDPRVDTYTAHLGKMGINGVLSFEIQSSDPAPPGKTGDTFVLKITDSSGHPMTGDISIGLYMPDHGHGTTVEPVITFDPATQTYTATPLYLFMPGVWRVQVSSFAGSADAGTAVDSALFYFCIEG